MKGLGEAMDRACVWLKELMKIPDQFWGEYAFWREPLKNKITADQRSEFIRKSITCGRDEADCIKKTYDPAGPSGVSERNSGADLPDLCREFRLKITYDNSENGGCHIIFAQFVEPDEITLSTEALQRMDEKFSFRDICGRTLEEILLAHEIFHYIESQKARTIYTRNEKIQLWRKPFSNRSEIAALSEIAGMAFACELLDLDFSPFALDIIMLYLYDEKAAAELYERVIKAWKESRETK